MKIEELKNKLETCKDIKLSDVSINDVDDLESIKIDKRKSRDERILDFLNKVKNPYIFKIKGKLVRIRFTENGKNADDCLTGVLKNLYR